MIEAITKRFPYWFCGQFQQYAGKEEQLPFDQHDLIALLAPRNVYIGSAENDHWADPTSEFLRAVAATPVYQLFNLPGFIHPDHLPQAGDSW